jgi:hypothetical protein
LITRVESCTNSPVAKAARGRLIGDLALVFVAAAYLGFVLFDDVESPLLSMLLIVAVAYELVHARRNKAESQDCQDEPHPSVEGSAACHLRN